MCGSAVQLEFIATQLACLGTGPCTQPDPPTIFEGTQISCPSSEAALEVRVAVEEEGDYFIELRSTLADGTQTLECFRREGEDIMGVSMAQLEVKPTILVSASGTTCSRD